MSAEEILIAEVKGLRRDHKEQAKLIKHLADKLDQLAPTLKPRANWQSPAKWMELTGKTREQWNYFVEKNKDNSQLIRKKGSRYSVNINNL